MSTLVGMSDAQEAVVLNHITGVSSYTMPTTFYIGLSTAAPNEDGTGFTEPSGNGYARVNACGGTYWNTATAGSVTNKIAIPFPETSGSWGTITYFGVFTAASGGSPIYAGSCGSVDLTASGKIARFSAAALTITLN